MCCVGRGRSLPRPGKIFDLHLHVPKLLVDLGDMRSDS